MVNNRVTNTSPKFVEQSAGKCGVIDRVSKSHDDGDDYCKTARGPAESGWWLRALATGDDMTKRSWPRFNRTGRTSSDATLSNKLSKAVSL